MAGNIPRIIFESYNRAFTHLEKKEMAGNLENDRRTGKFSEKL